MKTTTKRTRKTKDVYYIIWNREEVDSTEDRENAKYLLNEYNMAYKGGCTLITKREKI